MHSHDSSARRRWALLAGVAAVTIGSQAYAIELWFKGRSDTTVWTSSSFFRNYEATLAGSLPGIADDVTLTAVNPLNVAVQTVTLTGGAVNSIATESRLTQNITLFSTNSFSVRAGLGVYSSTQLTISWASLNGGTNPLILDMQAANGVLTLNSPLSVNGLNMVGRGRVVLTKSGTYGGTIFLNGGILQLDDRTAHGLANITFKGGTLLHNAGGVDDYSSRIVNSTSVIDVNTGAFDMTFASPIASSNTGGLVKTGSGRLTISAVNNYTGPTTAGGGVLEIVPGGLLPQNSGVYVNPSGTLRLSRSDAWGNHTTTTTPTVSVFQNGVLASNNTHTTIAELYLSGGTMLLNGGPLAEFPAFSLKGTVTVTGSQVSQINPGTGSFNAINIGPSETSGALVFNVGDSTNSSATDLAVNVPLQNQRNNAVTAAQNNGLIKTGVGTMTLSAANTYTGPTTVNGGTLELAPGGSTLLASAVTINSGGTLRFSRNDPWGNHTTTSSATVTVNAGGTLASNGSHSTLINLNLAGGTVLLNGGPLADFPSFSLKGTITVTGSQPSQINPGTGTFNAINIGPSESAGTLVMNVADVTGDAAADLIVNAPLQNQQNNTLTGPQANRLTKTGNGTLALNGAGTFTGGTSINGGALQLGHPSALGSTGSISFGGGALRYSGGVTTDYSPRFAAGSTAIVIDTNGQTVTYAATLPAGHTGGLVKTGPGTLILSSSNPSPVGFYQLNGGTFQPNNATATDTSTSTQVVFNGGTFQFSALTSLNIANTFRVGTGPISLDTNGRDISLTSSPDTANNNQGLTKLGAGTLTIPSSTSIVGPVNVLGGTLVFGRGTETSNGSPQSTVFINSSATLAARAGTSGMSIPATVTGTGTFNVIAGFVALGGNSPFTGTTLVSAGTLQFGFGGSGGSVAGPIVNNASIFASRSDNFALPGRLTGTGSLTKLNAGTLSFTGQSLPLVQSNLTVLAGAVDLTTNALVLRGASLATLRGYVAAGALRATPGAFLALAVFPNTDAAGGAFYASYGDTALTATDTLLRRTYAGDTNLDGRLNGADLVNFLEGFSTGATGWQNGDFDYNGVINAADYALLASGLAANLPQLTGGPSLLGVGANGAIPEPTQFALLAAPALTLLRRRRVSV